MAGRMNSANARRWRNFIKNADERTKKAAADALNEASDKLISRINKNLDDQEIKNRSGNLRRSIEATTATAEAPNVVIKSEVFAPLPKSTVRYRKYLQSLKKSDRHWKRRKAKDLVPVAKPKVQYPSQGVPYGRLIEFSPRIEKPFFYTAWYEMRKNIKNKILDEIGKAWSET